MIDCQRTQERPQGRPWGPGHLEETAGDGVLFDSSEHKVATLFSENAKGEFFFGKVVDMFYFPIWEGNLPQWMPFVGGDSFTFFQYIFNPADSFIFIGVSLLFIFSKQAFPKEEKTVDVES